MGRLMLGKHIVFKLIMQVSYFLDSKNLIAKRFVEKRKMKFHKG